VDTLDFKALWIKINPFYLISFNGNSKEKIRENRC
jgi:hypothetical protein